MKKLNWVVNGAFYHGRLPEFGLNAYVAFELAFDGDWMVQRHDHSHVGKPFMFQSGSLEQCQKWADEDFRRRINEIIKG